VSASASVATEPQGLDLFVLFQRLWRYRILIAVCGFGGALIAVVVALNTDPVYRAEVTVTEARDTGMGGAGSLASQLGGLASLAGVNIGQADNEGQRAQAMLESRRIAQEFITRNKLLPILARNSKKELTLWKAVTGFKQSIVSIRKDTRRGTTIVAMEWTDAAVAARWANAYIALTNELVRMQALEEANRNIAYLNSQIEKTNVVELRMALFDLVEAETKKVMLATGRIEYAFQTVDPAVAPELRIRPKRTIMVIIGGLLGGVLGLAIAFTHEALSRRRRSTSQIS
jgi:uncharacterized protein involved in exopolysaccharide biosynthesis